MPKRVQADAASPAAPPIIAKTRDLPPNTPPNTAPLTDNAFAAVMYLPATPPCSGSAGRPIRLVITSLAINSVAVPRIIARRAGEDSVVGAVSSPRPAAAVAAEPTKTNGISRCPSCQVGTAVSEISAAVYEATAGPAIAAPTVATLPT